MEGVRGYLKSRKKISFRLMTWYMMMSQTGPEQSQDRVHPNHDQALRQYWAEVNLGLTNY